ncbi:bifunctional class I SAM-dependent methyltransferase/HIT family protein [Alkalitalea saponilacus]|uniref:Diadenosine tetraphosphate (Ap4A) hydrolase n=1 Tax=Alkalitalea saponilacus TaxID=889453 RepID=A0A1T5DWK8_9BACT|nr:bifunctional class I SAM-dependent methyltransferase/HIT family protein [Alkalitalea saponilacus]ASB49164.1 HIT family protein [Alkalitalea saponilacus]SKB75926.1 Diadenosine tetraphosphate (Ap4A) hydrolase [Alkalitalea saponilacus]
MENLKSNPNSHLTAKEREHLSFPAKILFNQNLLVGDILDFGCGFGNDVKLLKSKGIKIEGYDKHYFPNYPTKKFDTIICFYVLNVLLPEEQATVLMELSKLIKPSGKVYIAVRRDLQFEGFRTHKIHQRKTYQCNVILNSKSFFRNENCEIYEYQHYNQLKRNQNPDCPFCNPDAERELIVESATAYAIYDKYPVNDGHALIIPKRHCTDYFELIFKEQAACIFMLNKVKDIVSAKYNPGGFNIGINVGEKAGQTVHHVHIHLIPRYKGDVEDPSGGVRGVIPNKQKY